MCHLEWACPTDLHYIYTQTKNAIGTKMMKKTKEQYSEGI
jgi:hypothetical protein